MAHNISWIVLCLEVVEFSSRKKPEAF